MQLIVINNLTALIILYYINYLFYLLIAKAICLICIYKWNQVYKNFIKVYFQVYKIFVPVIYIDLIHTHTIFILIYILFYFINGGSGPH